MPAILRWAFQGERARIFWGAFLACAFFSNFTLETNFRPRLFTTVAMIEHRSVRLDPYVKDLDADRAEYQGHYYSDKAPGSPFLMIPAYLLVGKPAAFLAREALHLPAYHVTRIMAYFTRLFSLSLFSALSLVLLYEILRREFAAGEKAYFTVLAGFFGTLMFTYSTQGFGDMFATPFIILGAWCLFRARPRYLGSGAAFAFAGFVNYPFMLFGAVIPLYILWRERKLTPAIIFCLPFAAATAAHLFYNYLVFDHPFSFSHDHYSYGTTPSMVYKFPGFGKIWEMLFGTYRGLFFYQPLLFLAIPGAVMMKRQGRGAEMFLMVGLILFLLVFFFFNAGWYGGGAYGFRYMTPVMPFCVIMLAYYLNEDRWPMFTRALTAVSILSCSMGAITLPRYAYSGFPLLDSNLPYLFNEGPRNAVNDVLEVVMGDPGLAVKFATTSILAALVAVVVFGRREPDQTLPAC